MLVKSSDSKVWRSIVDNSVVTRSVLDLFLRSPLFEYGAIVHSQDITARSCSSLDFEEHSRGPKTETKTLVFPCSRREDPFALVNTPNLAFIFRNSWGLRPSNRSPERSTYSSFPLMLSKKKNWSKLF